MDDKPDDPEFEAIVQLIREEEEAALEAFRRRDFCRRVRSGIGEIPDREKTRRGPWKLAIPVGATAMLLIAAWTVFSRRQTPPRDFMEAPGIFVAGLEGLPGMPGLPSRQAPQGGKAGAYSGGPPAIRGMLAWALTIEQESTGSLPRDRKILRVPRLSMERKMAILFKDRAIERVLVLIRKRSEEV